MKHSVPEISWHSRDAILSVDFQTCSEEYRIATGGLEKTIRIWKLGKDDPKCPVEFLSALKQHTATVNVVRFSKSKESLLASGDVSGAIVVWEQSGSSAPDIFGDEDEEPNKEIWNVRRKLRGHIDDVSDLCWSPDSTLIMSASMDRTVRVWKVEKGEVLRQLSFKALPSGMGLDPRNELLAVASSDRSLCIHSMESGWRRIRNITKARLPFLSDGNEENEAEGPERRLFHDDQLLSFIRRPAFSPCGELLLVPAGSVEGNDVTYLFSRKNLDCPSLIYPCPDKPTITVAFSPIFYKLDPEKKSLFDLPYRLLFAILSTESVIIYDTQQSDPLLYIGKSHYAPLTDVAWSSDARVLVVTSVDGYCSITEFEAEELGVPLVDPPPVPTPAPTPSHKSKKKSKKLSDISAALDCKVRKTSPVVTQAKETSKAAVVKEPTAQPPPPIPESVTPKTPKTKDIRQFIRLSQSGGGEKRKATSSPTEISLIDSSSNESDGTSMQTVPSDRMKHDKVDGAYKRLPERADQQIMSLGNTGSPLSGGAGLKKPRRVALTTVASPSTASNASPASSSGPDKDLVSPSAIKQKPPKRVKLMPV